ncbi:MAG: DUF4962 domain-containing protein [Sedimentisphaerales bacterium]|nr:DUF4962 domain-containing protein [Sedimentisphaerales bacterium]
MKNQITFLMLLFCMSSFAAAQDIKLDQRPAETGEWGYRPGDGAAIRSNPPGFSWRPQKGLNWEIECADDESFEKVNYQIEGLMFNVHCPSKVFKTGRYYWRYRGRDKDGRQTKWSETRTFSIPVDAVEMPMPGREELLSRVPKKHPRLFVRPENMEHLRELARGELQGQYNRLAAQCEKLLKNTPSTEEPVKYAKDIERGSEQWREIWWGNREKVIAALNSAATLGFTWLLDGEEKYGIEAKRLLLECARWDPKGSTGYRYNDEAGMPYAYYFSRTYSFINALLSEEERQLCREVMRVRGNEMYNHLCPRHLWQPYASHSNRAWHFLGEVAVAFHGEIEEADDWLWFAMNVFFNVYPVWSDDDGGWHEGSSYWVSYLDRFTWWADVMKAAMGINAYEKPYFSQIGYYAMYLMPPGKVGGGFGDQTAGKRSSNFAGLMTTVAGQAQNGYWQWWVEQNGGIRDSGGYIGFIRGAQKRVVAREPIDLPSSRLFKGTGQAFLNSDLTDASNSVQVVFKSSPFGTQSHGYEANNSFLLWGYGKRLLIRSGRRDIYGSAHHKGWMWSTRSTNCIQVNGWGQGRRKAEAQGEIPAMQSSPSMDVVVGEAGAAYEYPEGDGSPLERFTRAVIFVKPELVVVYDRLVAKEPSTYEYWLHAINEIAVKGQHDIRVRNDDAVCDIDFLTPTELKFEQTNQYDPNPRPRIELREWHLTASTQQKRKQMEFVTLYRVHRIESDVPREAELEKIVGGYALKVRLSNGEFAALLPTDDSALLDSLGLQSTGAIIACRTNANGSKETISLGETSDISAKPAGEERVLAGPEVKKNTVFPDEMNLFDGESLGQWRITPFGTQGKVFVEDGKILLEMGNDMTGVTWDGPLVRMNYEIELEAMRVEGNDFFCGLTFPVKDDNCTFVVGGWGGTLVGLSCLDYNDAYNNETARFIKFDTGKWYPIRVRVTDDKIAAWIEDKKIVDVVTTERTISVRAEVELSRPLGISTWRTTGAVRNIRLRRL